MFFPLASRVPEAEADLFLTFKSSMTTKAWFLLIVVEALGRRSFRSLAILWEILATEGRTFPLAPKGPCYRRIGDSRRF
jgi:hypothetical protein